MFVFQVYNENVQQYAETSFSLNSTIFDLEAGPGEEGGVAIVMEYDATINVSQSPFVLLKKRQSKLQAYCSVS